MAPTETDSQIEREETTKTRDSTRMDKTTTTTDNGIIIETIKTNQIIVEARKMDQEVVIIYLVASESAN